MIKYANTQGDPSRNDTWVQCESNIKPKDFNSRWFEKNCTVQEYGNMPIWEPSNYASNLSHSKFHKRIVVATTIRGNTVHTFFFMFDELASRTSTDLNFVLLPSPLRQNLD